MEPGRSIIGPTAALLTEVIYTKQQSDTRFIITNAAMNDLIRPTLYNAHHPILPITQSLTTGNHLPFTATVVGPICETGDTLGKDRALPQLEAGDLLAILQAGAYGFAMSSNYNGRVKTAEILIDNDTIYIIRQRQNYQHLLDGVEYE
jgi:diaminopimelate decarboxylase